MGIGLEIACREMRCFVSIEVPREDTDGWWRTHFEADIRDGVGAELGDGRQETVGKRCCVAGVGQTELSQGRQTDHAVQVVGVVRQLD